MYRKLCQEKKYVKPVLLFFFFPREILIKGRKISLCLRKILKSLSYEIGTLIKHYLDVRNLSSSILNENLCKRKKARKKKKSELTDANGPLRHLEF